MSKLINQYGSKVFERKGNNMGDERCCENTDRELWREREGDYYADSIHVTEGGGIGINCGGLVIVRPLQAWHKLAKDTLSGESSDACVAGTASGSHAPPAQSSTFAKATEDKLDEIVSTVKRQLLESQRANPAWSKAELWGIERDILPALDPIIRRACEDSIVTVMRHLTEAKRENADLQRQLDEMTKDRDSVWKALGERSRQLESKEALYLGAVEGYERLSRQLEEAKQELAFLRPIQELSAELFGLKNEKNKPD